MKRIIISTLATLFTFHFSLFTLFSQVPEKLSFQAIIRSTTGTLVQNKTVKMRISILQGSATGTEVYAETHTPTTNTNGLITLEIGTGTVETGVFENITWSTGTYFIKTQTDTEGGNNFSIESSSQLLSVPYALYAKNGITQEQINAITANTAKETNAIHTGDVTGSSSLTLASGVVKTSNLETTLANKINTSELNIYALKAEKDSLGKIIDKLQWVVEDVSKRNFVKDKEGNEYRTIVIGTQTWIAENLRATKYNDGTPLTYDTLRTTWQTTGAYAWYEFDKANKQPYGAYYNWKVVDTLTNGKKNICPVGWHVSNESDWTTLLNYLGNNMYVAYKLKAVMKNFNYYNQTTNSSNFNAIPTGFIYNLFDAYVFYWDISTTSFWLPTEYNSWAGKCIYIDNGGQVQSDFNNKQFGLNIRCIKD